MNPKSFGERLRKARIDAGLNMRELAGLIGVTEDTVINWEIRGRMPMKKRGSVLTKLMKMRFPSICPAIVDGKLHRATPKDSLLLSSL